MSRMHYARQPRPTVQCLKCGKTFRAFGLFRRICGKCSALNHKINADLITKGARS